MTELTIRARVVLWYGVVIVTVLAVVALAVSLVHERVGLARLDTELQGTMRAIDGVVFNELGEKFTLPAAAAGALQELELPGTGIAIIVPDGTILAAKASGVSMLDAAQILQVAPAQPPYTLAARGVRVAASQWRHDAASYRVVIWTSLAPFERERATLQNTMRISMPIAALAAMLGGWLIARWALRPLTAMAADAAAIDHRHLEGRLRGSAGRDELGQLGTAFNAVLDRLAAVVQAQRRFMADASHELRTPVSIARTAADVTLSHRPRSEAEYRESLDVIATQMRRLTRIVEDMFMLARADLDARPLNRRDLYLNEIVADSVRAARVLAARRAVAIDMQVDSSDLPARGDEELLRQLVMNLLDNAIRHAPDNGVVRVSLQRQDDVAEIIVEDSGEGIPAADHDRVFERFVRLDPAGSGGGAGLGLAIARWIAERHGGTLRVADSGQVSSRLAFSLPL